MEDFERDLDAGKTEEKKCSCFKFLEQFPEMFMYDWKYNHMMMRSSNPIESCMSVLLRNFNGKGEVREATFFNRYCSLVQWMFQCMEKRRNWTYTAKLCVPVEPRKKEIMCPWVVKEVTLCHRNRRELTESKGHYCICYSNAYRTLTIPSAIHRLLIALYASCIRTERLIIHKSTEEDSYELLKKGPSQANDSTHIVIAILCYCNSHEYEAKQPPDSEVVLEMKNPISNYPLKWTTLGRLESRDASYPVATIGNLKSHEP